MSIGLIVLAEEAGGLFDINATLPLMAIQFVVLAVVLNVLFYKPLGKAIDERSVYVRETNASAQERLAKAEQLAKDYEQSLGDSRRQARAVIEAAQAEAQKIAAQSLASAQQEAQVQREAVQNQLDQEKQAALSQLEGQVGVLSQQILDKLLGVAA